MAQSIRELMFDIDKDLMQNINAQQGDIKSRYVRFHLISSSLPVDLTNNTVKVFAIKPDNTLIFNNVTIEDAVNGLVLVELTSQTLAIRGYLNCQLKIYGSDNSVLSSSKFQINVLESLDDDDGAIESQNEFTALTEALGTVSTIENKADKSYVDSNLSTVNADLAEKANLSDLNTTNNSVANNTSAIASLASGAPAGVFPTLAILQADTNSNTTDGKKKIYVVTADGNWYYWNGTSWVAGGIYQGIGIADNIVTHNKMATPYLNAYIINGEIDVDTINKTITVVGPTTILTHRGYLSATGQALNYASSSNPTYAKYVYVNLITNTLEWSDTVKTTKDYALLGVVYVYKIWGATNLQAWKVNGIKYGGFNNIIDDDEISFNKTAFKGYGYIGYNTTNNIEIDIINKKFRVTANMNIIYHHTPVTVVTQDWTIYTEADTSYLKTLYVDLTDNKIKVSVNATISNKHIILLHFTGTASVLNTNIFGPQSNIEGVTVAGTKLVAFSTPYIGQIGYGTYNNVISIDLANKQIKLLQHLWIMYNSKSLDVQPYDWISFDTTSTSVVMVCYLDLLTSKIKVCGFDVIPSNKNIVILFRWQGSTASTINYTSHYSNKAFSVLFDGASVTFPVGNSSSNQISWVTNRFIIPDNLYLVKDIEYSIYAQNFNYEKFTDNDDCLFEIIIPSKTVSFENTADIKSSVEGVFDTHVVGVNKTAGISSALTKDIRLNIKDVSTIVNKDVKTIIIGDSIVNGNIPATVKYWLTKWGLNPTMLGTVSNTHDYGYGKVPPFGAEMGEGRGGWRLTDYVNKTRNNAQEIITLAGNPFLNNGVFDFAYYVAQNGFSGITNIIIDLGTNDIGGYSNQPDTYTPTETEYCDTTGGDFYMPDLLQIMIDSIHAFDSNIKIGINPPKVAGVNDDFNKKCNRWAEKQQYVFDGVSNVYCLSSYLGVGKLSGNTYTDVTDSPVTVFSENTTLKRPISSSVHHNGMNQLVNALWMASWIANTMS
ncbi:MAG: protein of uncharacterized function [Clostridiaceae bacterium]|jgi:hypothetical protein|nr:protein of uncharacterized function [Clostridiaceae bacterium]